MKKYVVSYLPKDEMHWVYVGIFRAKTEAGAIQQFTKDLRHFPNCIGIRAEPRT